MKLLGYRLRGACKSWLTCLQQCWQDAPEACCCHGFLACFAALIALSPYSPCGTVLSRPITRAHGLYTTGVHDIPEAS